MNIGDQSLFPGTSRRPLVGGQQPSDRPADRRPHVRHRQPHRRPERALCGSGDRHGRGRRLGRARRCLVSSGRRGRRPFRSPGDPGVQQPGNSATFSRLARDDPLLADALSTAARNRSGVIALDRRRRGEREVHRRPRPRSETSAGWRAPVARWRRRWPTFTPGCGSPAA